MSFVSDLMGITEASATLPSGSGVAGYEQRDRTVDPEGGFAKPFTIPVLSRQEIKERFEEQERKAKEGKGSRIYDVMQQAGVQPMNQGYTNLCWAHGPTDCVQVARVLMGAPHVPLSAASVAGPVTKYANRNGSPAGIGGWGIQAVKYGAQHGWVPQSMWPNIALDPKLDTDATRAERVKYRIAPEGWIDLPPNDWMSVFTCVALGYPGTLAHMEWKHLTGSWVAGGIASNGELMVLVRNSGHGRDKTGHSWIRESFGRPDEALAIQVVTGG